MAGRRYWKKIGLLVKREVTYGLDSVPTGAANAILATDVAHTPLAGTEVSRDLLMPYFGQQGVELVGNYSRLEFSVEAAGAGAAGSAPAYGPLLRACGMAEVLTANTSAAYNPISDGSESCTIYFNRDGVKHVLLGARGTWTLSLATNQIPRFRFTFTGLLGTITDDALPVPNYAKFIRPATVNTANSTLTFFGQPAVAESVSFDLGNSIEPRFLIGDESIEHTDRQVTGTLVPEARNLATVNWFDRALKRTRGAIQAVNGKVAGNIFQVDTPAVEVGRLSEGQTQNIMNYSVPLFVCPSAGNDEIIVTVK